eukprot:scaffold24082_cov74-Phaeocystis_antarctica.AAC.6
MYRGYIASVDIRCRDIYSTLNPRRARAAWGDTERRRDCAAYRRLTASPGPQKLLITERPTQPGWRNETRNDQTSAGAISAATCGASSRDMA